MLSYSIFKKQIELIQQFNKSIEEFENTFKCNISEMDVVQYTWKLFDNFLESHFTPTGVDLINWWLYEPVEKIVFESDEETTLNTIQDLWGYLIDHERDYFLLDELPINFL